MIGTKNTIVITVDQAKLASTVRSGDLDVLATPMMIAVMEQAASELLAGSLEAGQTSVGTMMHVAHTAATPLGMMVTVNAVITAKEGRQVDFAVTASDACGEIGKGTHTRFIVDAVRFQQKTDAKAEAAK